MAEQLIRTPAEVRMLVNCKFFLFAAAVARRYPVICARFKIQFKTNIRQNEIECVLEFVLCVEKNLTDHPRPYVLSSDKNVYVCVRVDVYV